VVVTPDRIIVVDVETTGLDPQQDRIVELCVQYALDDGAPAVTQRFDPGIPIPPEATAIHKISDSDVTGCPTWTDWIENPDGQTFLHAVSHAEAWVGYNPRFDAEFVAAEMRRAGRGEFRAPRLICAMAIWDAYEPRTLENAYRRFVDQGGFDRAHSADADVAATAAVVRAELAAFDLDDKPVSEWIPGQSTWWGSTSHVVWGDDGALLLNFGKHKGMPVHSIDAGFWRWILGKSDFPVHVRELANTALDFATRYGWTEQRRKRLHFWAKERS
jgi:DNA polymerase-3 subunit epsilon